MTGTGEKRTLVSRKSPKGDGLFAYSAKKREDNQEYGKW